jgi:two-component system OmpR family response regulator
MSAVQAVLYVEDEPLIREISAMALEDAGFEVVVAGNGTDALVALDGSADPFCAVVTDVNLGPGPDGWEVAWRARELNNTLPVIYVTGAAAADWPLRGVPDSVIIGKPFTMEQLVTAVGTILKRQVAQVND